MEKLRVSFADQAHPTRSGALVLEDDGRVFLKASPALAAALGSAVDVPTAELSPLHFDDARRGLALVAALAKGVHARLLEFEFVTGAFEVRAYLGGSRVRMTLNPGDFDADEAWEFLLAANEAKLEAAEA